MRNGDFLIKQLQGMKCNYIIEDLVPAGRVVLVASPPGEGKSLYSLHAIYSVAYGANFLGKRTRKVSGMLFDNDNPYDGLARRIGKFKISLESEGHTDHAAIDIQHYSGFKLDDTGTWDEAKRVIDDIRPGFIVFDHLRCFHSQNEDKSAGMQRVADGVNELVSLCGSAVMILHHFGKGEGNFYKRLRGSSVIYAKSEAAFEIRKLSRRDDGGIATFGVIEQPRKEKIISPFRVRVVETNDSMQLVHDGIFEPVEDPKIDDLAHKCAHVLFSDGVARTVNDFKVLMSGLASDFELRDALRILPEKGIADVEQHGRSHKFMYVRRSNIQKCPWCGEDIW